MLSLDHHQFPGADFHSVIKPFLEYCQRVRPREDHHQFPSADFHSVIKDRVEPEDYDPDPVIKRSRGEYDSAIGSSLQQDQGAMAAFALPPQDQSQTYHHMHRDYDSWNQDASVMDQAGLGYQWGGMGMSQLPNELGNMSLEIQCGNTAGSELFFSNDGYHKDLPELNNVPQGLEGDYGPAGDEGGIGDFCGNRNASGGYGAG